MVEDTKEKTELEELKVLNEELKKELQKYQFDNSILQNTASDLQDLLTQSIKESNRYKLIASSLSEIAGEEK